MKLSRSNSWRYLAKPYKKSTTLYREALSFTFLSVDIGPANTDTVSIDGAKVVIIFDIAKLFAKNRSK
jgi:hypothetical protein